MLAVVRNLGLSETQMKKLSAIIEAMQRYVDGHINETMNSIAGPSSKEKLLMTTLYC